ncbi:MAG TPA: GNAT family protein [Ktedonobacterales bacterium]|jgi:RimJ/RimL family protein N-acetyltransferase
MDVTFQPITPKLAHELAAWRYPAPYDTYDIGDEAAALAEMLDSRSPWFVTFETEDEDGAPLGYCCFGTAAEVGWEGESRLWTMDDRTLSVGLGLRPDLTGQRLGLPFFAAVLAFAAERFRPTAFRLFVLPFNQRAIRVYERAGFRHVGTLDAPDSGSDAHLFLEMRREIGQKTGSKSAL